MLLKGAVITVEDVLLVENPRAFVLSLRQYSSLTMHKLYSAKEGTGKDGSCSISCSPGFKSLTTVAHSTSKEFENGVFTLKTRQMFCVHTPQEEFKNATISGHFEENSVREVTWLYDVIVFEKLRSQNVFRPH